MVSDDYLSQLNDPQRQAVEYIGGPALVIAGAGSGKTRVLTYKIVHLLKNGFEPWRILALTFTNKAAAEMRQRIEQLTGQEVASRLWMGTFHSVFARILRANADRIGFRSDFTIYDAADSKSLIKTIIRDMQLDDKVYKPSSIQTAISMAKNALMSPEAYASDRDLAEADRRANRPMMPHIYSIYMQRCRLAGAMDFDDLLYYTNVLMRDNEDVRDQYRERFRYILVDEYQDTNFAQHHIISQICNAQGNLCVVGDDAQSIYSFRGANIRNILTLQRQYPTLATFKLEQNYRSTQNILNAANSLIAKNVNQIPKTVFSDKDSGELIRLVKCENEYSEGDMVASAILRRKAETGDAYDEFAVLYRTNAQSRVLEEKLRSRNIPYRTYGGMSFYQRAEVKNAIAYMRLSVNPDDDEALRRIINVPARGIGETTVSKLLRAAIDSGRSIWQVLNDIDGSQLPVNSGTRKRLDAFTDLIRSFIIANDSGENAEQMAMRIIRDTRLLAELMSERTPENISKQENLHELLNGVKEFVETQTEQGFEANTRMTDYLAQVSLLTDQDEDDDQGPKVMLMTVHAAKGLEFGNVYIIGLEKDLFPSSMATTPSELEEERRLLYVAITRAKRFCMLSYASQRMLKGQPAMTGQSMFIRDIDPRYLKTSAGAASDTRRRSIFDGFTPSYSSSSRSYGSGNFRRTDDSSSQPQHTIFPPQSAPAATRQPIADSVYITHAPSELSEGMRIEHERFGTGSISSVDTASTNPRIIVNFDNQESKTLLLKFAKFRILQ